MNTRKRLLAFILCAALLLSETSCRIRRIKDESNSPAAGTDSGDESGVPATEEELYALTGMHFLNDKFSDITVTDEESAVRAAAEGGKALGLVNALSELKPFISTTLDGEVYYRLQQTYQGIPVFGRYVTLVASEDGEVLGLSTDAKDIPENIDLTPTITDTYVQDVLKEYAMDEWGVLSENMMIQPLANAPRVIYNLDETLGVRPAYEITVENGNTQRVILDAKTGDVLEMLDQPSSATGTLVLSDLTAPIEIDTEDNSYYYIHDNQRNIYVIDLNGQVSSRNTSASKKVTSKDTVFGNTFSELDQLPEIAFEMLNTVTQIHTWYSDNLNVDTPFGELWLFYRDLEDFGLNAYASVLSSNGNAVGGIKLGMTFSGKEIDMLAHEYGHLYHKAYNTTNGKSLSSQIIAEGLGDVFSCFVTGKWVVSMNALFGMIRDASDPGKYHYPSNIHEAIPKNCPEHDQHAYATVISHAAYLMSESKQFTEKRLWSLWFNTMISLPYNCSYINLRSIMEHQADIHKFTDQQKDAIADAFDEVGITRVGSDTFGGNVYVYVYDKHNDDYDDYTIEVTRQEGDSEGNTNRDASTMLFSPKITHQQTTDKPMMLELEDGEYRIKIIDNAYSKTNTEYYIKVDSSNENDCLYAYDFGPDYTVAPGAVLTVLDIEGKPLTDYAVLIEPSIQGVGIDNGLIHLPERNYYRIQLAHTEGQNIYFEHFTLRVQNGASDSLIYRSMFHPTPPEQQISATALTIEDFLGSYMDMDPNSFEPSGFFNYSLMDLYYDEEGQLTGYSRQALETTGTTFYFPYTSYEIDGDRITLQYEKIVYPYYGSEYKSGSSTYTYADGNLQEDLPGGYKRTWYRVDQDGRGNGMFSGLFSSGDTAENVGFGSAVPADRASLVQADHDRKIPADAVEWNGHYYRLYTKGIATCYDLAEQFCELEGGYLATLTSEEENAFVYGYILSQGCKSAFFGFSDAKEEKNWEWVNSEDSSYTNWKAGEPNAMYSDHDYACFSSRSDSGVWDDANFDWESSFICEWGDADGAGQRNTALDVGSLITFGSYEQDNDASNGPESIEWVVLAQEADRILVVSRYGLDHQPYNLQYMDTTWEKCTVRTWLNGDFLSTAFTDAEAASILTVSVTADKNPEYASDPGNSTKDRVFLLSAVEVETYFSTEEDRLCLPTPYAREQGAAYAKKTTGACTWRLRTPGERGDSAVYVAHTGEIGYYGGGVATKDDCVRPALWIQIGN